MSTESDNMSSKGTDTDSQCERNSMKTLLTDGAQPIDQSGESIDVECNILRNHKCPMSCEDAESSIDVKRKSCCCTSTAQCVWSILLIIAGATSFFFTPLDVMLREKLNMRPGMPPYEWWADPPDEVILRVYVFNVTNHERFLDGIDDKLNYEEIGPIVYLEKLTHHNITFNENDTLTYTARRTAIFQPERNDVDMNATLIAPNLAVLGMASYLHKETFLMRSAFRVLVSSHGSQMFSKKTVYEYLWDYRDPVLETSSVLVSSLVPVNNMGMLSRIYANSVDKVTVKVGPNWGDQHFFQISRVGGQPQLPGYDPDTCPDRLLGSTEGVMYHQYLKKSDVLLYWRKSVCRLMPLYFDQEMVIDNVPVLRYNLSENTYERVTNGSDCYDTSPPLPAGISDASKCYYDFPMVVSYPHFYTGFPPRDHYVTGLKPDKDKHNSYAIVEPMTGTPFRSVARMQANLRIHSLSAFGSNYNRFSNLVLPLFWAEYNQEGLPANIGGTIYFMVVILPPLSIVVSTLALILGSYILLRQIYVHNLQNDSLSTLLPFKSKNVNSLTKSTLFSYETQSFLKKPALS